MSTTPRQELPATFDKMLRDELEQIDNRRDRLGLAENAPPDQKHAEDRPAIDQARERRLVGLSFSGGGIRSATFNLGVLQGLAGLGLLKIVDYLSTVSGGGYIGGWLAAFVRRRGSLQSVERTLTTGRPATADPDSGRESSAEPNEVQHLRRYSNYLAPRQGFLSADSWVLWASYARNFLLNQLVLLPVTVAVLLVSRLAMLLYFPLAQERALPLGCFLFVAALLGVLWLAALVGIIRAAVQVRARSPVDATSAPPGETLPAEPVPPKWRLWQRLLLVPLLLRGPWRPWQMLVVVVLLLLSAVVFCALAPYELPLPDDTWKAVASFGLFAAVVIGLAHFLGTRGGQLTPGRRPAIVLALASAAGIAIGCGLFGVYALLHQWYTWDLVLARDYIRVRAAARVTTFGPPLVLATFVLGICAGIGLLRRWLREEQFEWWSGLCGRLLVAALIWLSVNLVALYGTALVLWAGPWMGAALGSGWLLTVIAGVVAGKGSRTDATQPEGSLREWLARLAPHVFIAGLLVGVSVLIHWIIDNPPNWRAASPTVWPVQLEPDIPPTRITTTRVRGPAAPPSPERKEVTERSETVSAAEIVRQTYWLGILNTVPNFVPREDFYVVEEEDLKKLRTDGVSEVSLKELRTLKGKHFKTRTELADRLDRLLPDIDYAQRGKILLYTREVKLGEFNTRHIVLKLLGLLALCVVLAGVAAWCADVNRFSLHGVYRNRLVRCYLGASRPRPSRLGSERLPGERRPDPVTEFDPDDDLALSDLRVGRTDGYDGPFLIVNTALNLVHGDRLDWQERKAESFVLTPLYCGSEDTGYRPTAGGYGGDVSLGTAVTLSGAAASPNMGYHSSPAVTALLTVFNARLGAWLGNPASPTRWRRPGPKLGFLHLFRELFGWTRAGGGYVYLSDGGHFENLGGYELIRRRCQYVIVSDAGQDPAHSFEDLGNLIHKCRIDLGIAIDIDLDAVRRSGGNRCRWHCAIGRIRYDLVDEKAMPGTLVYLKPSLTGDEPADVLHYSESHADFPHHTTADQFFDESDLESYRALGEHVARSVFVQSVADVDDAERRHESDPGGPSGGPSAGTGAPAAERYHRRCRELFASLVRRWFAMPPDYEPAFVRSTHGYIDMQEAFRRDGRLWRLTLSIYPELDPSGQVAARAEAAERSEVGAADARVRAEVHVIAQMLQVMENAWLSLKLDVHYAHPLNRGWMDVFHRWTSAPTVREHWPLLRAEMGRDFVSFCEKQMRMGEVEGRVAALSLTADRVPELLAREFRSQWPDAIPGLENRLQEARDRKGKGWLIFPKGPSSPLLDRTACGIILVTPDHPARDTGPVAGTACELFVWMRGAYRNTGLGRHALGKVLNQLRGEWRDAFTLYVRLPVGDLTGPGGELQKQMWMTFFHHYDFVQSEPAAAARVEAEVRLERRFPAV